MSEEKQKKKVAIVTGANAGVGFGIMERLLEAEGEAITIIMACRNHTRASHARDRLLQRFPFGHIDIELVDVGKVSSVLSFCEAIGNKYRYLSRCCSRKRKAETLGLLQVLSRQLSILQCWNLERHRYTMERTVLVVFVRSDRVIRDIGGYTTSDRRN